MRRSPIGVSFLFPCLSTQKIDRPTNKDTTPKASCTWQRFPIRRPLLLRWCCFHIATLPPPPLTLDRHQLPSTTNRFIFIREAILFSLPTLLLGAPPFDFIRSTVVVGWCSLFCLFFHFQPNEWITDRPTRRDEDTATQSMDTYP